MGTPIAIVGIAISLFGFIDALATPSELPELQTLRYILAAVGLLVMSVGAVLRHFELGAKSSSSTER